MVTWISNLWPKRKPEKWIELSKYNPYHDRLGRFAGATSTGAAVRIGDARARAAAEAGAGKVPVPEAKPAAKPSAEQQGYTKAKYKKPEQLVDKWSKNPDEFSADLKEHLGQKHMGREYRLAEAQGFTGLPRTLSKSDMDARIKDGDTELFRGVEATKGLSASELSNALKSGGYYSGYGVFGGGIYTAPSQKVASGYAGNPKGSQGNGKPGKKGMIFRMALNKNARVIEEEQVHGLMRRGQKVYDENSKMAPAQRAGAKGRKVLENMFHSYATTAIAHGYDAIKMNLAGDPIVLVLNRSALSIQQEDILP